MPPKRKAAAAAKGPASKKAKTAAATKKGGKKAAAAVEEEPADEPEAPSTAKQLADALKKSDNKKRTHKVDALCVQLQHGNVVGDYDCMLNQTNIGNNNNKFYVIQVIQDQRGYWAWNRWGRVGEPGANAVKGPYKELKKATDDFQKKFYDKTQNQWAKRDNFKAVAGKYTLLEMGDDEPDSASTQSTTPKKVVDEKNCQKCTLDQPTQDLVKLIFDNDMFKEALEKLEIDVKKMPLGKISKAQIAKGFEALEKIEDAIDKNAKGHILDELSSEFYTLIPHNFGRNRPTRIDNKELLRQKMDLLMVLADIELAQAMQREEEEDSKGKKTTEKEPHPLDTKYNMLHCKLKHLDPSSSTYKIIENYTNATKGSYSCPKKILDVWEVDRETEGRRFAASDKIGNRKLLWHGTNVAVVAAILKTGLRIMPHSGGRVGKGIYFASENGKSSCYVGTTNSRIGIMFLNEVALGKEYEIGESRGDQTSAPNGYDSIVARGRTEPDPLKDSKLVIEGKAVVVPQGKPINQPKWSSSHFSQSEYLIYREDQCRIRYLLKLQF